MAQKDTGIHTLEYDHAPVPAAEAELPDFGEADAPHATGAGPEDHEVFDAPDFGGASGGEGARR